MTAPTEIPAAEIPDFLSTEDQDQMWLAVLGDETSGKARDRLAGELGLWFSDTFNYNIRKVWVKPYWADFGAGEEWGGTECNADYPNRRHYWNFSAR